MKQVIVITGGSHGLGKELATLLSPDHHVVIIACDSAQCSSLSAKIDCDHAVCDITNNNAVESVLFGIIKKYHRLDVLINNAGIYIAGPIDENDPEQIRKTLDVNTLGTIFCTRAVVPQMKTQRRGQIINIISQSGLYPKKEKSVYRASKWAITGFTKSLQMELPEFGIKVTGVYPGDMATGFKKDIVQDDDVSDDLDPKEVARFVKFIIESKETTFIPELGIKHIDNML